MVRLTTEKVHELPCLVVPLVAQKFGISKWRRDVWGELTATPTFTPVAGRDPSRDHIESRQR